MYASNPIFEMLSHFQVAMKDITVAVGDHVVVAGLKTGLVKYVGHIDGASDKHCIFVGLQLDAPGKLIADCNSPNCLVVLCVFVSLPFCLSIYVSACVHACMHAFIKLCKMI